MSQQNKFAQKANSNKKITKQCIFGEKTILLSLDLPNFEYGLLEDYLSKFC